MSDGDPVETPSMLFVRGETFVGAQRYEFFDLRWFLLPGGPCEPERALAALITQPKYREDYWSDHPDQGLRGDYVAARLTAGLFEPSTPQRMVEELRDWVVDGWRRTDNEQREATAALEGARAAFGSPTDLFRLRDLNTDFLPTGYVEMGYHGVFAGDWIEHVGLYPSGEVCVMVAATC